MNLRSEAYHTRQATKEKAGIPGWMRRSGMKVRSEEYEDRLTTGAPDQAQKDGIPGWMRRSGMKVRSEE
jgi:hypothetical protein